MFRWTSRAANLLCLSRLLTLSERGLRHDPRVLRSDADSDVGLAAVDRYEGDDQHSKSAFHHGGRKAKADEKRIDLGKHQGASGGPDKPATAADQSRP